MKELDRITINPEVCLGQPTKAGNEDNGFSYTQTNRQRHDHKRAFKRLPGA